MKAFILCLLVLAGCSQSVPITVDEPKPKTEKERLAELWEKVKPLQPTHDMTPEQFAAILGPSEYGSPHHYSWGTFEAITSKNDPTICRVFNVSYRNGKVSDYEKTQPIFLDGSPPRFSEDGRMVWDKDQFRPNGYTKAQMRMRERLGMWGHGE
jgi:hypothetical protein